jgi:hypothetical protein
MSVGFHEFILGYEIAHRGREGVVTPIRLLKGWPGKPLPRPLTDVYTVSVATLVVGALELRKRRCARTP